jgi:cell division protease FtsH
MAKNPKINWGTAGSLRSFVLQVVLALLVLMTLVSVYSEWSQTTAGTKSESVALSKVAEEVKGGAVKSIVVDGDDLEVTLIGGQVQKSRKESNGTAVEALTAYGISAEELSKANLTIKTPSSTSFWIVNILQILGPVFVILILFWLITRQMKGAQVQAMSFGQSKARMIDPSDEKQKVTFKDVAGVREAKEELTEIVDFLKNPKKFLDIGARIPKGVLMIGGPGTGKTLLARAVAGEAGVPFFYLSASEFVEMFVGVGASRVRDLFAMAKAAAPAIIFIDEIDAIGRHRGSGLGGGNDEREQTLNQILVEMDGFEPTEKLIMMAATNRPDVLDSALLRPGRFDRRVTLDSPDIKDREAILTVHSKTKPLGADVNFKVVAQRTPGFSGADLANVVNEGAILAAREDRQEITQYDLLRSVEKVMLGPERKSHILGDLEKKITAYHEIGHALVASVLPHSDPVHKVSIISRGYAAGYTLKLPIEDKKLNSRKEFLDDIAVGLAGFATEQMIFDDITTGASNDIQVATGLARSMVTRFGMNNALGPIDLSGSESKMSSGGFSMGERTVSEATQLKVDEEVAAIINTGLARAREALQNHRKALDDISLELVKVETMEREDFNKLLILHGIKPKQDSPEASVAV